MIQEKPTCDSLNTFAEWFFIYVTGTPTDADDRSKVYNVSILLSPIISLV
jgi:hypothetical protein